MCGVGEVQDEWTDHSRNDEEDKNVKGDHRALHSASSIEEEQPSSRYTDWDPESGSNLSFSDKPETLQSIHPAETTQSMSLSTHWSINNLPNFSSPTLSTLLVLYLHLSVVQFLSIPTLTSIHVCLMSLLSLHAYTIIYSYLYSTPQTQLNHPKHIPSECALTASRLSQTCKLITQIAQVCKVIRSIKDY